MLAQAHLAEPLIDLSELVDDVVVVESLHVAIVVLTNESLQTVSGQQRIPLAVSVAIFLLLLIRADAIGSAASQSFLEAILFEGDRRPCVDHCSAAPRAPNG